MDRGFDDVFWLRWMHANVEQSVIRVKSNRSVHPGTTQEKAINIGQLAETLDARHTTQLRYVNKSNHVEKFRSIPFAWVPIWVKGVDHALYLIVAHTGRKRPLLLVTDCRPASTKEAGDLIQSYLEPTAAPGYPRPSQGVHSHGPLRGVQNMAGRPDGPPPRLGGSFALGHVVSAVAAVRASIAHPPALANGDSRYQAPATRSMQ